MLSPLLALALAAAPTIDGVVDPAEWRDAILVDGFTQEFPTEGGKPGHDTRVRLTWDEKTLYLAFQLDEAPGQVTARLAKRDESGGDDSVEFDVDTRGDGERSFHFELGAAGVQRDAIRTGDYALDFAWDAVWTSAVKESPTGWSAEIALPLTALRFEEGSEAKWRFQFRRFVAATHETDAWVHIPRADHGELQRYRALAGLPRFTPPRGVELRPFVLGRLRRDGPVDGPASWAPFGSVGLDARLALTSGLSLDATVLPDFGQVEADQALLNLSTFEINHPEKRPFFLEGADLFALKDATGNLQATQLFYSRRLGAPVPSDVPDGHARLDAPDVARIWGAAKVTGRLGEAWSVALLDGVVAAEEATLTDGAGAKVRQPLSPTSNFLVARVSRAAFSGLTLGVTATDVRRAEAPGSLVFQDYCPDFDVPGADRRCTRDATTAAVDATWMSESGDWAAQAMALGSLVQSGPERVLRDATVVKPGSLGWGGRVEVSKTGGSLRLEGIAESYAPTLDLNDAGFLRSQNLHRVMLQAGWRWLDLGPTKELRATLQAGARNSWDGVPYARSLEFMSYAHWANFWNTWWMVQWSPTTLDNRETWDGARTERPSSFGAAWWFSTNGTSPVVFSLDGWVGSTWRGTDFEPNASLTVRAGGALEVSLSPNFMFVNGDPRWVDTLAAPDGSTDYVFGLQDALAAGATLRLSWTLTPKMSFTVYAQGFAAQVHYPTLFRQNATGDRPTLTLAGFEALPGDGTLYDSKSVTLNSTALFRWEYLPGSVLSLVYSHGQSGSPLDVSPSGLPRIDLRGLGRVPTQDVVLAKLTYFWSR